VDGDLKVTQQKKLCLQENSMKIDLEAKQDTSGICFKYETERTKDFKKNQEIDLSDKSVTCPSKEAVTSRIIVLGTCVQRHGTKFRYVQGT
jgi:hypothetical protein